MDQVPVRRPSCGCAPMVRTFGPRVPLRVDVVFAPLAAAFVPVLPWSWWKQFVICSRHVGFFHIWPMSIGMSCCLPPCRPVGARWPPAPVGVGFFLIVGIEVSFLWLVARDRVAYQEVRTRLAFPATRPSARRRKLFSRPCEGANLVSHA